MMGYYWGGWFLFWIPLVLLILWAAYAWTPTRRSDQSRSFRDYRPYGSDFPYPTTFSKAGYRGRGPRGYHRSDTRIEEEINDRLFISDEIDATDVLVKSKDGVVTLSGQVHDRGEKRIAEMIADSVPGVTDVKNELMITPLKQPSRAA